LTFFLQFWNTAEVVDLLILLGLSTKKGEQVE
jgi:hypothetical protein